MKKQALIATLLLTGTFAASYGKEVFIEYPEEDKTFMLDLTQKETIGYAKEQLALLLPGEVSVHELKLKYKGKILSDNKRFFRGWPEKGVKLVTLTLTKQEISNLELESIIMLTNKILADTNKIKKGLEQDKSSEDKIKEAREKIGSLSNRIEEWEEKVSPNNK